MLCNYVKPNCVTTRGAFCTRTFPIPSYPHILYKRTGISTFSMTIQCSQLHRLDPKTTKANCTQPQSEQEFSSSLKNLTLATQCRFQQITLRSMCMPEPNNSKKKKNQLHSPFLLDTDPIVLSCAHVVFPFHLLSVADTVYCSYSALAELSLFSCLLTMLIFFSNA